MKKTLPIFLVILLIAAVVVNKRFLVDMENETVEEIINEIEITQEEEKSIVQEVKPKEDLREEHVEAVQQIPPKTKKIVEQDLSREEGEYDDGKKDGLWKYWDQKGNKWQEGAYLNGERDGSWITWNANGKKRNETVYKNGEFVTKKEY